MFEHKSDDERWGGNGFLKEMSTYSYDVVANACTYDVLFLLLLLQAVCCLV